MFPKLPNLIFSIAKTTLARVVRSINESNHRLKYSVVRISMSEVYLVGYTLSIGRNILINTLKG